MAVGRKCTDGSLEAELLTVKREGSQVFLTTNAEQNELIIRSLTQLRADPTGIEEVHCIHAQGYPFPPTDRTILQPLL